MNTTGVRQRGNKQTTTVKPNDVVLKKPVKRKSVVFWVVLVPIVVVIFVKTLFPYVWTPTSFDTSFEGAVAGIQVMDVKDINPEVFALARTHAKEIFRQRPKNYRQTNAGRQSGFCKNVVSLSQSYIVSLWTGRPLATNKDPRQPWPIPYNCPSGAGIQCFFNTSGILIDNDDLQKPSLFESPVCWSKKYEGRGNRFPRDDYGLPLYYSRLAPLCKNVPFFAKNMFYRGSQLIKMAPRGAPPSTWIQGKPLPMVQLSVCLMWNLNDDVQAEVDKVKKALGLQHPYAALHIRRGDKQEESLKPNALEYLKHIPKDTKEIFIATDGIESLEEAKAAVKKLNLTETIKLHPSFLDRTFHKEEQAAMILNKTLEATFRETVELITEIDILADADVFVGTGSSNVGAVAAALRACRGHSADSAFSMDMVFERQLQY